MTKGLFSISSLAVSGSLAVLLTGLAASPALAKPTPAAVNTSACFSTQPSQPFLAASDTSWYTLAPGQTPNNFNGGGWTLSGGAQIITTRLADGTTGSVLDLPSGSQAVSSAMCVTSDYPTARAMVQGTVKKITFSVSYAGTKTADKAKKAGTIQGAGAGWSLSNPFNTQPGTVPGWQIVQFTFSGDSQNDARLYNFYVDPRMH